MIMMVTASTPGLRKPSEYLSPIAHAISHSAARNRINQCIVTYYSHAVTRKRRELEEAYRRTTYSALTPVGELRLRIDEPSVLLKRLLEVRDAGSFAYLTASNPLSRSYGDEENALLNEELARLLAGGGYVTFPGHGSGDDASWAAEPSFLVLGIARDDALELAKRFQQNAILHGSADGIPRLLWCQV